MAENRPGDDRARVVFPQMQLDDLLAELQVRLSAVLATRDRVHALLEAVVSVGSDLDLETVLRRIVEAATTLVDARYGALGVIGEGGGLAQFVTVGVSEEEIAAIGRWPAGHGLLGLLIEDPRPLRLGDISAHPESSGFPANHPPMKSFLGVPIRVRDEVFGNLYLTEKIGGGEFDEDDQSVVTALATAAGVAIENARLYQEARRRERWLEASSEVSTALLSGVDPDQVMGLVARRGRAMCDADLALVFLAEGERFTVAAADGVGAESLAGLRVGVDDAAAGEVFGGGEPVGLMDSAVLLGAVSEEVPAGPGLVVALGADAGARGVVVVVNERGRGVFSGATRRLLQTFAAQAAVALELAERRADVERLVVLEDRDRIAKDLHDTVIQRLFATAMTLMTAIKITQKREVAVRVQHAVDDLDDTIRQIRSTIFALQAAPGQVATVRTRVHGVIDAAAGSLGFAPGVRLDGLLDTAVEEPVAQQLLAVLHEALSNVARHARASRVRVGIDAGDDLVLVVEDDGVGIGPGGRRSGLRNMADRAADLGGSFTVSTPETGGTRLEWRVPLTHID